ncbi:MAG: hypothetical protein H6740_07615 [Alphaproteobacteria bacterium]|nr:hypothetical protein [Alphaproteobacteria bacterium]
MLMIALTSLALAQTPAPPPPCQTTEHRQFDFWVGDWTVTTPDGEVAGTNHIAPILNGCVLQESWTGAQGGVGHSFNMYDAAEGVWRQTWVDGRGGRLDLSGHLQEDGSMLLTGARPGKQGGVVQHELRWTPKPDGSVVQRWRISKDGGQSWEDAFLGVYTKAAP